MKARLYLLESDVDDRLRIPPIPTILVEENGYVIAFAVDWSKRVAACGLDDVTPEQVKAALGLSNETVHLGESRELPSDDMLDPEMLTALQDWWLDVARVVLESAHRLESAA